MEEIFEDSSTIKSLSTGDRFQVRYEIHILTSMKRTAEDPRPTPQKRIKVISIEPTDVSTLLDGEYEMRERSLHLTLRLSDGVWTATEI